MSETGLAQINVTESRQVDGDRVCITEMPTCCGYPSAGDLNYPKGRGNKGAGRNNKQEIFGGAARQPSICIVCAVAVCTVHSLTSWIADRNSTYCFPGHSRR